MKAQCWHGFAYPEKRCPNEGRWRSPDDLCQGHAANMMKLVRWCIYHKHRDDVECPPELREETPP